MLLKAVSLSCLIVTKLATMLNSIMDRLHMMLKVSFLSFLIATKLATIFNSIMNRLHMLLKAAFLSCLIVTKLATIFNSIMDRLHMLLKTQNLQLCSYIMKSILGGLSKECQKWSKITFKGHYWSKTTDFRRFHLCVFLNVSSNVLHLTKP